jgi:hypothetical protein
MLPVSYDESMQSKIASSTAFTSRETIMASLSNSKPNRVSIKTLPAHPLSPNSSRPVVKTNRLIIRALVPEDLQSFHVLRTQPEIMANNPQGRIEKDLEETKPKLDL